MAKAKKIKIRQIRSLSGCTSRQRRTIEALGLGKICKTIEVEGTPQILGMVKKVSHIVEVEK